MEILKDAIQARMVETGRLPEGGKIEITAITEENWSDYRRVEVLAYRKRCRKPFMAWNLCIDIAKDLIHWDTTTFYKLK
jgi:hypothetical protein